VHVLIFCARGNCAHLLWLGRRACALPRRCSSRSGLEIRGESGGISRPKALVALTQWTDRLTGFTPNQGRAGGGQSEGLSVRGVIRKRPSVLHSGGSKTRCAVQLLLDLFWSLASLLNICGGRFVYGRQTRGCCVPDQDRGPGAWCASSYILAVHRGAQAGVARPLCRDLGRNCSVPPAPKRVGRTSCAR